MSRELGFNIDLKDYHQYVSDELHSLLSTKRKRVLDNDEAMQLLKLPSIQRLLANYPNYQICNVVYDSLSQEPRPQFYFRLVRPNHASDVGSPHCDFWFDEAMNTQWGRGNTIKFWIPVITEAGKNGLYFFPNAPRSVPFRITEKDGLRRPAIEIDADELGEPVLPCPEYGQAIVFDDDVMHCGALNTGSETRVSVEITLVRSV